MRFSLCKSRPVDKSCGLRCDQTIRLRTYKSKRDYPKKLRRISFFAIETRKRLVFQRDRTVLQVDQTKPAHQSIFRDNRERRANSNLDRNLRLLDGGLSQ